LKNAARDAPRSYLNSCTGDKIQKCPKQRSFDALPVRHNTRWWCALKRPRTTTIRSSVWAAEGRFKIAKASSRSNTSA
jgi:hypothetical protein